MLKLCAVAMSRAHTKLLTDRMRKVLDSIPIFEPSHPMKLLWDTLNMVSISFFLLFFPIRVTFGLPVYDYWYSTAALTVLIVDVFVTLNTGYYEKGTLVNDKIGILMNYLRRRIISETVSFLPFILTNFSDSNAGIFVDGKKTVESIIALMFLVRLLHLSHIKRKIEERFYQRKMLTHILSLFSLLLNMIYIAHILACVWILVAEAKKDSEKTWMHDA